jgi:NAD(P)H-hydrate epimerase
VKRVAEIPRLPPRPRDGHKGTFGTVLVIAGSNGMLGAAILCARGAVRGGAGLVRACLPAPLLAPFTIAVPAATTLWRSGPPERWCQGVTAVVAGPGLGRGVLTRRMVKGLLRSAQVPLVLDADALNELAPLRAPLRARAGAVLTPHPGEAARLLGVSTAEIQDDRSRFVAELARQSGNCVVLKGSGSLVCDGERLFENTTGNPGMATGGTGDVLAGLIGALLAQGMAPFDAACLGVHVHGRAGDLAAERISPVGMSAEDLPLLIAEVLGRS